MKKLIALLMVVVLGVSLCACGGESNDTTGKGSRNNPYKIGETINFTADYEGSIIDVKYTVNDLVKGSDAIKKLYDKNNIVPDRVEELMLDFSVYCNGNYDSDISLNFMTSHTLITNKMGEDSISIIRDEKLEWVTSIYTDVEYQLYACSDKFSDYSAYEYKYLKLQYKNTNGEDVDIWIELTK